MKRKVLAGLVVAGVVGISGAALADFDFSVDLGSQKFETVAKAQNQKLRGNPPAMPSGDRRPPMMMSGDRRPPEPPDGKFGPMSGDKRPPRNISGDRRPPEPPSGDKRPPKKSKPQQ